MNLHVSIQNPEFNVALNQISRLTEEERTAMINARNQLQIDSSTSRDTIKAEQKLMRKSKRNKKTIRKTTLIKEIHQLLESGVELCEDDQKKFRKISFTNDRNAPIDLKQRPKKLKKYNTRDKLSKKFLETIKSISHIEDISPPPPPLGNPPRDCPQPKLKHRHLDNSHFHQIPGVKIILEMLDSIQIGTIK